MTRQRAKLTVAKEYLSIVPKIKNTYSMRIGFLSDKELKDSLELINVEEVNKIKKHQVNI